jgi:hypothetical protein
MKVKPHFIIVCREAFLEAGTNNLNLIRIFTQAHANAFPFALPAFALVVNFDIDTAGPHVVRTEVLGPDGTRIAGTDLPITTNVGNWQVIANFEQLKAPTPGAYTFQLTLDDQPLGEKVLNVIPTSAPKASRTPAVA